MPLGPGVRYRHKTGSDVRLAFRGNQVVEAKNMKSGATHTPAEFKRDRAKRSNSKRSVSKGRR